MPPRFAHTASPRQGKQGHNSAAAEIAFVGYGSDSCIASCKATREVNRLGEPTRRLGSSHTAKINGEQGHAHVPSRRALPMGAPAGARPEHAP